MCDLSDGPYCAYLEGSLFDQIRDDFEIVKAKNNKKYQASKDKGGMAGMKIMEGSALI